MEKIEYKTVEELLTDESFLSWHHLKDDEAVRLWNEWIAANPEHRMLADEAVRLLLQVNMTEKEITGTQTDAATDRLMRAIELESIGLHGQADILIA